MMTYVEKTLERVQLRNKGDVLFLQAVRELLSCLEPVLREHPQFHEANVLERLCEPQRQVVFQVPWVTDAGKVVVNRGFRVGFNNTLGPYKGGLRFHPDVDVDVIKFLAFEQVFKNSLTGLRLGGGKGGADFDPRGRSEMEVMRFCQSFMNTLFHYIGPQVDIPAGDIGVGAREVGYLFGHYKTLSAAFSPGAITGKDPIIAGSLIRKEATGYGCVYFAQNMLERLGEDLRGKTCVVSGAGNVAIYAMEKLEHVGAKTIACSDCDGAVYDPQGINVQSLKLVKEVNRACLSTYCDLHPQAVYTPGVSVWSVPCQAAFPCATQNELKRQDAIELVKNGCKLVCEGANMPCTPEAIEYFEAHGVAYAPGKASNAGGVAVSGLEMQQNATQQAWSSEAVDAQLQGIMQSIHHNCLLQAQRYGSPNNYVKGANIAGFLRVAQALLCYGV